MSKIGISDEFLGARALRTAANFEAAKRHNYPAFRDTVLLWEIGMRAFQSFDEPDTQQPGGAR